jgi:hypothetical protein
MIDMHTLEGEAATDIEKLRAELLIEMDVLHGILSEDVEQMCREASDPVAYILLVIGSLLIGLVIGYAL